jgi:histidyl-tRNA synthetase
MELLKEKRMLPTFSHKVDDIIILAKENARLMSCKIASKLRKQGCTVDIILQHKSLKHSFKYADKIQAFRAILVFDNSGEVFVKELITATGERLPKDRENKQIKLNIEEL